MLEKMTSSTCKLVVLSDMQIDHHDQTTLEVVHRFLEDYQPQTLVLNGDIVDMTALGRFRLTLAQRASLLAQRESLQVELGILRSTLPDAKIVYVLGNHEQRLVDYITDNAAELGFLGADELSFSRFAHLDFTSIGLVAPYGAGYDWHGVLITHGTRIVSNTAKANLDYEGSSGISGHTHRMSSFFKTDRSGAHAWFEGGCLCTFEGTSSPPPGLPGIRNWQQGFIVGEGYHAAGEAACTSKLWNIYPVHITNHQFIWGGKLYAP